MSIQECISQPNTGRTDRGISSDGNNGRISIRRIPSFARTVVACRTKNILNVAKLGVGRRWLGIDLGILERDRNERRRVRTGARREWNVWVICAVYCSITLEGGEERTGEKKARL